MKIKRILCPVDFSESCDVANRIASQLATVQQSEIVYLTVPPQGGADGDYAIAMHRIEERALKKISTYHPSTSDIPYSHRVKVSSRTAQTIVEFAGRK